MGQLGSAGMKLSAQGVNPAGTQGQASPYQIGGGLNFGTVPGLTDYQGAYQNALSLNQQNYSNILGGYQNIMGNQQGAQQNIQAGYGTLENQVLGGIQGIGASQSQAIKDVYAQQSGNSAQQMINSGLGNTTVQQSVQRGNLSDEMKAQTGLANQLAQLQAGYQSNLGMAGLNFANQANMQNTGLGSQQLGFMNSVNSPYPNAQAYGQLAMQQGYASQAAKMYGSMPKGIGTSGGGGTAAGIGAATSPSNLLGKLNTSQNPMTYGSSVTGGGGPIGNRNLPQPNVQSNPNEEYPGQSQGLQNWTNQPGGGVADPYNQRLIDQGIIPPNTQQGSLGGGNVNQPPPSGDQYNPDIANQQMEDMGYL